MLFCDIQFILHVLFTGSQVCCGKAGVKGKHSIVSLLSEAARAQFQQINACPPSDPATFALKLPSVFFTQEELAKSNCTKADSRKLLDQDILQGIKLKGLLCWLCIELVYMYTSELYTYITDQTNLKYPTGNEEARWMKIVIKSLNAKCRSACRDTCKN